MKNLSTFQIILLSVFGFLAVAGLIAFAAFQGASADPIRLTIWSELDSQELSNALTTVDENVYRVTYKYIPPDNFEEFVFSELSLGRVPDLLIADARRQYPLGERLYKFSYDTLSKSDFQQRYVKGSNTLFLDDTGFKGVPLFVDPLLMYWNEQALSDAGIPQAPAYWDEFTEVVQLTTKKSGVNIFQPAAALGTFSNISEAKALLSAMFLQVGEPVAEPFTSSYQSAVNGSGARSVVSYYTDFANPQKAVYNWNQSFGIDWQEFISDGVYLHFNFASFEPTLVKANPNLPTRVSELPQIRDTSKSTFARFYGAFVPAASKQKVEAINFLTTYLSGESLANVAAGLFMSPATRNSLGSNPNSEVSAVSDRSSLYAEAWPDTDINATSGVFSDLIEDVLFRGTGVSSALQNFSQRLNQVLR